MKNKAQSAFLTTFLFFVVIIVVIFMYVYQPNVTKTQELEASNATLKTRVDELEGFYKEMPAHKAEMEKWTTEINQKLAAFPVDTKEEDSIYLVLRTWEEGIVAAYTSIGVGEREVVTTISEDVVKPATIDGLETELVFKERTTTYNNITTYNFMKELVKSINENPEAASITNLVYTTTEEGLLEGSIDVTFYLVEGTNREYQKREFKDYPTGDLTNLFGTIYIEDLEQLREAKEADEEESERQQPAEPTTEQ